MKTTVKEQKMAILRKRMELQMAMADVAKKASELGLCVVPVCDACIDDGFLVAMTQHQATSILHREVNLFNL